MKNNDTKRFSWLTVGDTLYKVTIDWEKTKNTKSLCHSTIKCEVTGEPYNPLYAIDLCIPYKEENGNHGVLYIPQIGKNDNGAYISKHIMYLTDINALDRTLAKSFKSEIMELQRSMEEQMRKYKETEERYNLLKTLMFTD